MTATFSRGSPPLLTNGPKWSGSRPRGLVPIGGDHGGRRVGDRQHDDVALVALHALKVPDDQLALTVILKKCFDALITRPFEQPHDQRLLLSAQGDHTDVLVSRRWVVNALEDVGHDRFCLFDIGVKEFALASAVEAAVKPMPADRCCIGPSGVGERGQAVLVEVVVAERDQGLVAAAVVALKVEPLKVGLHALRQDALQVFKHGFFVIVWLYVGVRSTASTELAGWHLPGVTNDDHLAGPSQRADRLGDRGRRSLVEHHHVEVLNGDWIDGRYRTDDSRPERSVGSQHDLSIRWRLAASEPIEHHGKE